MIAAACTLVLRELAVPTEHVNAPLEVDLLLLVTFLLVPRVAVPRRYATGNEWRLIDTARDS